MPEDARLKLDLRLVPAEGEPDPALLDDLVRLIRQGIVTASTDIPQVNTAGEFHPPADRSQNDIEAKITHRIEQASKESEAAVAKRAEIAAQPDAADRLAAEALDAAREVVATVQRAMSRGIAVQVPDDVPVE